MNILTGRIFRLDKNNELLKLYMYQTCVIRKSGHLNNSQGATSRWICELKGKVRL